MSLNIPLDLPGQSFIQQLEILEQWACLIPGTLIGRHDALAKGWDAREGMTPVILECLDYKVWDWPTYNEYVSQGGFRFSNDLLVDMAEHIHGKFRSNRNALYRKSQLESLIEFRPFWQLVGKCSGCDRNTYLAIDDFWKTGCAPWNCPKLDCDCRVQSLTRTELAHYVEKGCESDPAAVDLLKNWG